LWRFVTGFRATFTSKAWAKPLKGQDESPPFA
jgi:hypothetical protein